MKLQTKITTILIFIFLIFPAIALASNASSPLLLGGDLLIPISRVPVWNPGVQGGIPNVPNRVNIRDFGAKGDGSTDDTTALKAAISACPLPGAVYLPTGSYVIKGRIPIPSGLVLRGNGPKNTHILATPGTNQPHTFTVYGKRNSSIKLMATASKGTNQIMVADISPFVVGQTAELEMDFDQSIMTNMLAGATLGQMVKIVAISGQILTLDVPLRLEYPLKNSPRIYPVYPKKDVGFEDFHVKHVISDGDQSMIFDFRLAINSWVKNVESEHAALQHISLTRSRHITIQDNVVHHAFNYGGNGQGYGIAIGLHSSDNLITNNTLYMLRHSLSSSLSASGNVWSYNFSTADNSTDDTGLTDVSLHGSYIYMDLFEGNVVQWINIGDYWGAAGPQNTFFRNRTIKTPYSKPTGAYRAGIEINSTGYPSHEQNIIGNTLFGHIWNRNNYQGTGDYAHNLWIEKNLICQDGIVGGDLDQNAIRDNILNCKQSASWNLPNSFYLSQKPGFWPDNLPWPAIGADIDSQRMAAGLSLYKIPAQIRYEQIMGLPPSSEVTSTPVPTSSLPTPLPNPDEIIIDNKDAGFSTTVAQDAWQEYTKVGGQHYGNSHYYNKTIGSGQDTATWSFTVPKPGNYDVYAWWWAADYRPTDVPYTINYAGNNTTARMNQQTNGGQWNLLGTYYFENNGSVIISDNVSSGQDIAADAIRLVYRSATSPEVTPTPVPTGEPTPTPIPNPNPGATSLTLDGPTSAQIGQTFNLNVVARNVPTPGLYGVQLELNYNPALISAGNLQVNPNLSFVVLNNADNATGKIRLVASQQGKVSGLTGDVTLLSFDATAANTPGVAIFTFNNQKTSDFQAQGFNLTDQSYSVTIAGAATPEPTAVPTGQPTSEPTTVPTDQPTPIPTTVPTDEPTPEPTAIPTDEPTPEPTAVPTDEPTPEPTAVPTDPPTPEPTAVPTDEPTPIPTAPVEANVSGQVVVIGRADNDWSGSTITIASSNPQATLTDLTGNFHLAGIPAGTHTLTADAPGYLSAVCTDVSVTAPNTALQPVNLLSGDINDDNVVDITDATAVGAGFGLTGSGLPADITRDGVLDIFDIVLVSINFGEKGPQTWGCLDN